MAAATGSIAIASAGGSFDSATYPRFVLGDGTNSLEFVIDNDARGLKLSGGSDAAGYSGAGDLPFEDSQKTRLVVPTFDEADGAKKALLAMWITDDATFDDARKSSWANWRPNVPADLWLMEKFKRPVREHVPPERLYSAISTIKRVPWPS